MDPIFLWWLALGALIGFVAEWIWDWLWFRRRQRIVSTEVETQVGALRGERDRLVADLKACGDQRARLEGELSPLRARVGELEPLQARVGGMEAELTRLRAELRSAGDRNGLLEGELGGLRGRVGELEPLEARVGELSAENERLRAELDAARADGVTLGAAPTLTIGAATPAVAALSDDGLERSVGGDRPDPLALSLRNSNVMLYDELEATRRALVRLSSGRGDPLIDIDGIGPVYQRKLYEAGVVSFEQVAAMSPERLRAVVAPSAAFEVNTEGWIAEARRLAGMPQRDPLIDINGIGPVYEQRLLQAGVSTFEQLAAMAPEEVRAIIRPEAWQNAEVEVWIAEARSLAEQVRAGTYRKGLY